MNRMRLLLAGLLPGLCILGCGFFTDRIVCTEVFAYGVNVTVADENGRPMPGATVTITDGDFVEVLEVMQSGSFAGAGERAGTYTLTVEADGFAPVTITDIFVDEDECHVIPIAQHVVMTQTRFWSR